MISRIEYHTVSDWPKLAWVAQIDDRSGICTVYHGVEVETHSHWFGEIVWAGDFSKGDLDLTDHAYGSGGRLRDGNMTFVGSASIVERLNYISIDHQHFASNSLLCLLAITDADIDRKNDQYHNIFFSMILRGRQHALPLPSSRGDICFIYYDNLRFNGRFEICAKPETHYRLDSYADVESMLLELYGQVYANATDSARARPLKMAATMSRGYDSSCSAALASRFGLTQGISINKSFRGKDDTAYAIASPLGINLKVIDTDAWRQLDNPEPIFLAGSAYGEDVHFAALEADLDGTLLHTGFFGDAIWTKSYANYGKPLAPSDICGNSLGEFRLRAGFISFDVPGLGAANRDQMVDISNSEEMRPWDYNGEYSRPIPRRFLEEMSVPRESFGIEKQGASHNLHQRQHFLSESSENAYAQWLQQHKIFRAPALRRVWDQIERSGLKKIEWCAYYLWRVLNHRHLSKFKIPGIAPLRRRCEALALLTHTLEKTPLISRYRRYVFGWAIDTLLPQYKRPLQRSRDSLNTGAATGLQNNDARIAQKAECDL